MMKEAHYIAATNLAKARMVETVLGGILPQDANADNKRRAAIRAVYELTEALQEALPEVVG